MRIPDVGATVCRGDSGGPVYKNNQAFGLIADAAFTGTQSQTTHFGGTFDRECAGQASYWTWRFYKMSTALAQTGTVIM